MRKLKVLFWLNKKKICCALGLIFLFAFLVVMSVYEYCDYLGKLGDSVVFESTIKNLPDNYDFNSEKLNKSDQLVQEFVGNAYGISEIDLLINKSAKRELSYKLYCDDVLIDSWEKPAYSDGFIKLKLHNQITESDYKEYKIIITSNSDKSLNIPITTNLYVDGNLYYNGNVIDNDIAFSIIPAKLWLGGVKKMYVTIVVFMLVAIIIALLQIRFNCKLEYIALSFAMIFGIIYMLVLPPFSAPDEPRHYATAYQISNIMMGVTKGGEELATCRRCDDSDTLGIYPNLSTYEYVAHNILGRTKLTENSGKYVIGKTIPGGPVVSHLPQAIGITIGRLLKFNYVTTIYLSQFMNLLVFAVALFISIRLTPVGKYVFLSIAGLPMLMQQAASCSYDILIIAFAFTFVAYMLKLIYSKTVVTWKNIIVSAILIILLAPCKLIYFVTVIMVWLVPGRRIDSIMKKLMHRFGIPLLAVVSAAAFNMGQLSDTASTGGVKIIEWANEEGYTVSELLNNIPHTIMLFISTYHDRFGFYVSSTVGSSLGWFDIAVPLDLTIMSIVLLVLSVNLGNSNRVKPSHRMVFLMIFGLVFMLSCATMLLGWTPKSYHAIEGVQGRYLLPVLPLLLISFASKNEGTKVKKNAVIIGTLLTNYLVVLRVFESVALR